MLAKFREWYATPFRSDQNVTGWALFVLLLIVLATMWRIVLGHILHAAD